MNRTIDSAKRKRARAKLVKIIRHADGSVTTLTQITKRGWEAKTVRKPR